MIKDGLLLVDKPKGITSNQTLKVVKRNMNVKKAGIVGILDPLASGMLPIVIGEATKLSKYIENSLKQYNVEIKLGVRSDTGDNEGQLIFDEKPVPRYDSSIIEEKISEFVGDYYQIPPMYSAVKVKGKKLYELAREGIEIERDPRKVTITEINLLNYMENIININVKCSKGTYIRTLVEDIGQRLGVSSITNELRREGVGDYQVSDMTALSYLKDERSCLEQLIDLADMVSQFPSIHISYEEEISLRNGIKIGFHTNLSDTEVIMLNGFNKVVGIGYIANGIISPKRILKISQ